MPTGAPPTPGVLGSLRGFADGILGTVHDRLELLTLELHEEKHRLIQTIVWIGAIAFLGVLAMLFASLTLVLVFWDTARLAVAGGLAGIYLASLIGAVIGFRRLLARQPKPFAATLAELQHDRECIQTEN